MANTINGFRITSSNTRGGGSSGLVGAVFAFGIIFLIIGGAYVIFTIDNSIIGTPYNIISNVSPDVILQYSNGLILGFNSVSNNNVSRGSALVTALSYLQSNSEIYLRAETYNISTNEINLTAYNSISIYGAGKEKTNIIETNNSTASYYSYVLVPCNNCTLADLSINFTGEIPPSGYGGAALYVPKPYNAINFTIRNVNVYSNLIGGLISGTKFKINIYNLSMLAYEDGIDVEPGSTYFNSIINIFDSNIITPGRVYYSGQDSLFIYASVGASNIIYSNIINTNMIAHSNQPTLYAGPKSSVVLYGGNFTNTGNDGGILQQSSGVLFLNKTVKYSSISGTYNTFNGAYGTYNYQKYPETAPGNWLVSQKAYTSGVWQMWDEIQPFLPFVIIVCGIAIVVAAISFFKGEGNQNENQRNDFR